MCPAFLNLDLVVTRGIMLVPFFTLDASVKRCCSICIPFIARLFSICPRIIKLIKSRIREEERERQTERERERERERVCAIAAHLVAESFYRRFFGVDDEERGRPNSNEIVPCVTYAIPPRCGLRNNYACRDIQSRNRPHVCR